MRFDWNSEKNEMLKESREVSFEEIATFLAAGKVWKVMDHPNPDAYPNQRVFLVPINNYIFFVPFVMEEDVIFLKTAFPHRKATKQYLKEKQDGR
jgi:uncharacterized DUF497 family protein